MHFCMCFPKAEFKTLRLHGLDSRCFMSVQKHEWLKISLYMRLIALVALGLIRLFVLLEKREEGLAVFAN